MSGQWKFYLPEHFDQDKRQQFLRCTTNETIRNQYMGDGLIANVTFDMYHVIMIIDNPVATFLNGNKENVDYALKYVFDNFDDIQLQ